MKNELLILATICLFAHTAHGQDLSAVRGELIERAQRAQREGNHRESVDLARRALEIQQTPSLHALIAVESLEVREFAEAYDSAVQCRRGFQLNPALPNAAQFLIACEEVINRAQTQVGRVIVNVPSQHPNQLVVRVNSRELPAAVYGVSYIVNPGNITVEINAPGHELFRTQVQVTAGTTVTVPFQLGREIQTNTTRPLPAGAFLVTGLGAAGFISAGIVFAAREGALSQLRSSCDPQTMPNDLYCRDSSLARQQFANVDTLTTATNITIGISTAVTVTGVAWLIIDRVMSGTSPHRAPQVSLVPSTSGVLIQGTF